MKNRFVDVSALWKRQEKRAYQWVKQWMQDHEGESLSRHKNMLEAYLAGQEDVVHLGSYLEYLQHDYFMAFVHGALCAGELRWEEFARAARFGLASLLVQATPDEKGEDEYCPWFTAALVFALQAIAGWQDETRLLFTVLHRGMDTNLLDMHGTPPWEEVHLYFLLLLGAEYFGQPIDPTKYIPKPERMQVYSAALAHWRSTDLDRVQRCIEDLAEDHVRNTVSTAPGADAAFELEYEWVFPYEILTYLRFREWAGLPNPEHFAHPLLHTPLAVLPKAPLPWPALPELDQAIAKFRRERPQQNYFDQLPPHTV